MTVQEQIIRLGEAIERTGHDMRAPIDEQTAVLRMLCGVAAEVAAEKEIHIYRDTYTTYEKGEHCWSDDLRVTKTRWFPGDFDTYPEALIAVLEAIAKENNQ